MYWHNILWLFVVSCSLKCTRNYKLWCRIWSAVNVLLMLIFRFPLGPQVHGLGNLRLFLISSHSALAHIPSHKSHGQAGPNQLTRVRIIIQTTKVFIFCNFFPEINIKTFTLFFYLILSLSAAVSFKFWSFLESTSWTDAPPFLDKWSGPDTAMLDGTGCGLSSRPTSQESFQSHYVPVQWLQSWSYY